MSAPLHTTFNVFEASTLLALAVNVVLGAIVYGVNPERRANRYFLIASMALSYWLGSIVCGLLATTIEWQLFWVRHAHGASVALPMTFDLLRLAIAHPAERRRYYLKQLRIWPVLFVAALALAHSNLLVRSLRPMADGFLGPVNGPGQYLFIAIWILSLIILVRRYKDDLRGAVGLPKMELQFTLLGSVLAVTTGLFLGHIIPITLGNRNVIQLMPLCVIVFDVVLAYGIATHRIMNVGDILRRSAAYILMTGYLLLLYVIVFAVARFALDMVTVHASVAAHLSATIAVAVSLVPAEGRAQRVANRLFISLRPLDMQATVQQAHQAILSIGTTGELLSRFAELARGAAGTDRVLILQALDGGFRQTYPLAGSDSIVFLDAQDPLVVHLKAETTPLNVDAIRRLRADDPRQAASQRLQDLRAVVATGLHAQESMIGILVLGPRLSGRIYGADEHAALQFFGDQIGVALENARLYTEVQDGKIYNDILLDSLVSGVVAVNARRAVTVFNREAQRVTGLAAATVIGSGLDALPRELAEALASTQQTGSGVWERDAVVQRSAEDQVPVRIGTSCLRSHTGEPMGALLVLHDMTLVKKLEAQVRRTDRLASLGTLSAGMAHEIKNPLVSLKTFAQLLPERYQDEEFRSTFSRLIVSEIQRIDTTVNRLLHFARPAKARLGPLHLHDVTQDAFKLLEQQFRRSDIRLEQSLRAQDDLIRGDHDPLIQALINIMLNGLEAMQRGGTLTVATRIVDPSWQTAGGQPSGRCVRLSISDTGHGIRSDDLPRIFDPFYTTKDNGTGLGLSVTHGIVQEHDATIDVESRIGVGTTFHLTFPLGGEATTETAG